MSDTITIDGATGEVLARGEVVPFDASVIDQAADPGHFVELACARAKEWLAEALERGDIDGIVELKSQAEAIRTYTAQKQLGKDTELSAQEIVRRAERGLGVAIRKGQESGEIRRHGETVRRPIQVGEEDTNMEKPGPGDFLSNTYERRDAYAMAEGVTSAEFEDVIDEARAEKNMTRKNVIRKVQERTVRKRKWDDQALTETFTDLAEKGYTSAQVAEKLDMSEDYVRRHSSRLGVKFQADAVTRVPGGRRPGSDVVVEGIVTSSEVSSTVLGLIEFDQLDPQNLERWISSLSDSIRSLTTLKNNLKKELTRG